MVEVATQGRTDYPQWVTSYYLQYTNDGISWFIYDNKRLFPGNTDQNTIVKNTLPAPLSARAIRIVPFAWVNYICMRAEVYIIAP